MLLEIIGRGEGDDPAGLNWDLCTGLRIAAYALTFVPDHKVAEARQLHVLSSLQCIADLHQHLLGERNRLVLDRGHGPRLGPDPPGSRFCWSSVEPTILRCPRNGRGLRGIFLLKLEHKGFQVIGHVRGKHIIVQAPQGVPEDEGHLLRGEIQAAGDLTRPIPSVILLHGIVLMAEGNSR